MLRVRSRPPCGRAARLPAVASAARGEESADAADCPCNCSRRCPGTPDVCTCDRSKGSPHEKKIECADQQRDPDDEEDQPDRHACQFQHEPDHKYDDQYAKDLGRAGHVWGERSVAERGRAFVRALTKRALRQDISAASTCDDAHWIATEPLTSYGPRVGFTGNSGMKSVGSFVPFSVYV